jgi:hypothetical protein
MPRSLADRGSRRCGDEFFSGIRTRFLGSALRATLDAHREVLAWNLHRAD